MNIWNKPAKPSARRVLVLGGAGFIGRHVAAALKARGVAVVIGSRRPARRCPAGVSAVRVRLERRLSAAAWRPLLDGVDAVVNCVGILRPRGRERYEAVHHRAPAALARACAGRGIRFVHVSALGLDAPVASRFLTSKRSGEQAIRQAGGDWHIVRPSLVDGRGGFGARWVRRVADWPLHAVPANAAGLLAPLAATDLGEAVAELAVGTDIGAFGRVHELGGMDLRPMREHLAAMRSRPGRARAIALPGALARLLSHLCDLLHATPYSYGHYELLQRDNVPADNQLPALLRRPPLPVGRRAALLRPAGSPAHRAQA